MCIVSSQELERLPLVASVHPCMTTAGNTSGGVLFNTTGGDFYLHRHQMLRPVIPSTAVDLLRLRSTNVTLSTTLLHPALLDFYRQGGSLPDIYRNNSLYKVKGQRVVYVTLDGFRRMVWSANVFSLYPSWRMEDVVEVNVVEDMELLPIGLPVDK